MIGIGPPVPDLLEDHLTSVDEPRASRGEVFRRNRAARTLRPAGPAAGGGVRPECLVVRAMVPMRRFHSPTRWLLVAKDRRFGLLTG
jgi:hypothetical protein